MRVQLQRALIRRFRGTFSRREKGSNGKQLVSMALCAGASRDEIAIFERHAPLPQYHRSIAHRSATYRLGGVFARRAKSHTERGDLLHKTPRI
jgi:hypothetical protein